MDREPRTLPRFRTSIRTLMGITLVIGCWFGLYRVDPVVAWLASGLFFLFAVSIVTATFRHLFWAPLAITLGWLWIGFTPPKLPLHPSTFNFTWEVGCIISICVFTIHRTVRHYRVRDRPHRVVFTGILYSCLAGVYGGLMFSIPVVIAAQLRLPMYWGIENAIARPFPGLFHGLIMGLGLGFICDILVALEFRKREPGQTGRACLRVSPELTTRSSSC